MYRVDSYENTLKLLTPVIEIPKWLKKKYEFDKASGLLKLDMGNYPASYGFIPHYCL